MDTIIARSGEKIRIGKQGETGVRRILLPWLESTSIVLLHRRRGDAHPYSGTVEKETIGGEVYAVWYIVSVDTAVAGVGEIEVSYYKGETIAKTVTYFTVVDKSVEDGEITVPTASATWVQNVANTTAQAVAARNAAAASAAAITNTIQTTGQDTIDSIPADYTALSGDVESLKRKVMAVLGGLALRDIHGASTQTYIGNSQAECPDLDNFLNDGVTYIPAAYAGKIGHHPQGETNSLQGIVVVVKTLGTKNAGIQIWIPTKYDHSTIGMFFYRYLNFSNSRWRNEWFTIGASNGVNESALNWEVE